MRTESKALPAGARALGVGGRGGSQCQARPTLMRTPFVKRQTPPSERFWLFFRLPGTRRSRSSVACPDLISLPRCTPMWRHHTRIEALAPVRARAEKAMHGPLRPRNTVVPSARPMHKHGCTVPFASESQVRRRGSTQQPLATIVVYARARAGVQSRARAPGYTAYAHLSVDRRSRPGL